MRSHTSSPQAHPNVAAKYAALVFGGVAMVAGVLGVPLGSVLATRLRHK